MDFCQGLVDSDNTLPVRRAAAKMVAMVLTDGTPAHPCATPDPDPAQTLITTMAWAGSAWQMTT